MPVAFSICLLFRRASNCQRLSSFCGSKAFSPRDFSSTSKLSPWKTNFPLLGDAARREGSFYFISRPASSIALALARQHKREHFPTPAIKITSSAQAAAPRKRRNNNQKRMAEYNIEGFESEACKSARRMIDEGRIRNRSKLPILPLSDLCMKRRREWTRQPEYFNGTVQ
jgi:hypothetical protein